jgi:hypothetical protein
VGWLAHDSRVASVEAAEDRPMSMNVSAEARLLQQHPVSPGRVVGEGLLAGVMASLSVGLMQLVVDVGAGEFLRTPAALHAMFLGGGEGAETLTMASRALRFTVMHSIIWLSVGLIASLVVSFSDAYPKIWYTACAATAFVFLSLLYASVFLEVPGLPRLHASLGVIIGPLVIFGWLARRHPGVLKQFDRTALTEAGAHDLADALLEEHRTQRLYQQALALAPNTPVLAAAIATKQAHIDRLLDVFDRMDAIRPARPPDESEDVPSSLEDAYRQAIVQEGKMVEMYDRFLAAVDELKIRDVFVHLRESSADELQPSFERALVELRSA